MRILYIEPPASGSATGGIERYARELPAAMKARGHDVERIDGDLAPACHSISMLDHLPRGRYFSRFYFRKGSFVQDYRYHNALGRRCARTIDSFKPDLVHCLHAYQYGALADLDLPTAVTCYGLEIDDIPPVRGSLTAATGIHCISQFTQRRMEAFMGSRPNARVLSWGVKTPPAGDAAGQEIKFDLITMGRVVHRKNLESVIAAVGQAPELRYAIVGDGPDLNRLQSLVGERGMKNVQFFGWQSDAALHALLRQSRLFIMCPRKDNENDVEGLGLVYYEAHAAGLPTIGAHSGGVPEAIGDAGLIVQDPLSPDEILAAIRTALAPPVYGALKANVARRQLTHSWDQFVSRFETWYEELAA